MCENGNKPHYLSPGIRKYNSLSIAEAYTVAANLQAGRIRHCTTYGRSRDTIKNADTIG